MHARRLLPCGRPFQVFNLFLIFTAGFFAWSATASAHGTGRHRNPQNVLKAGPVTAAEKSEPRLGAVASESAQCSQVGIDLLKAGGSAADALVGTVFCVGVIGMYHSGIGGGGFMLVRDSDGQYETVDFRESAPAAASEDMYSGNLEGSIFGGLAAGVPGELRGLEYLHQKHGRLPWATVMRPAIDLARNGWEVGEDLVRYMDGAEILIRKTKFLSLDPAWAIDFAPNGTRLGRGDRITRGRYADTLEEISQGGADAFYTGSIARSFVAAVRSANGTMTLADLRDYRIAVRSALAMNYKDYRLFTVGAPAGGAVVMSTFKTIEGYKDSDEPNMANLSLHRLDEAIRFGYAERASLGDPFFLNGVETREEEMMSGKAAKQRRAKISDQHTLNVSDYNPDGFEIQENHGTSHIVAADASGMAISVTTTVNLIFGGGVMVPETGIVVNNEMNDFSVPGRRNEFGYPPSPANYIRPGKRPMSSITPVIVEHKGNGSLYYVVGSAGGSRIITATIQNLWHTLDHGMNAAEAIYEPRFHDQLLPNNIQFEWGATSHGNHSDNSGDHSDDYNDRIRTRAESGIGTGSVRGFDNYTVAFMASRGHNVSWVPQGFSSAQALRLCWNGTFEAAGEPRQKDSGGFAV